MQYHRGLLRQSGHGWGGILKTVGKFATPIIGQVVGGLLGGALTQPQQGYGGSVPQSGRGLFTDLLKSGAKSVLTAAAKTGLDVLENKRSLKDALKTHGIRAAKNTAGLAKQRILTRGGPKTQQLTRSRIPGKKRQLTATRASGKKRQPKKIRSLDIFD